MSIIKPTFFLVNLLCYISYALDYYTPKIESPFDHSDNITFFEIEDLSKASAVIEAPDGDILIGDLHKGVFRYDGIRTTSLGLAGIPVQSLHFLKNGDLLAATDINLFQYHNKTWKALLPEEETFFWMTRRICEEKSGAFWVSSLWGGIRIDGDTATLHASAHVATSLSKRFPSLHYVTIPGHAVPHYDWQTGPGIQVFSSASTGYKAFVHAVAQNQRNIEIGTMITAVNGSLAGQYGIDTTRSESVKLNILTPAKQALTLTKRKQTGTWSAFMPVDIFQDRNGDIWFADYKSGIIRYSSRKKVWKLFDRTEHEQLKGGWQSRILQHPDGTIFISCFGALSAFDGTGIQAVPLPEGQRNPSSMFLTQTGKLFLNFKRQTFIVDKNQNTFNFVYHGKYAPESETAEGNLLFKYPTPGMFYYSTPLKAQYKNLHYHGRSADGRDWFLSNTREVIQKKGNEWLTFSVEDGLMRRPYLVGVTANKIAWAFGLHYGSPAVTLFTERGPKRFVNKSLNAFPARIIHYESRDEKQWFAVHHQTGIKDGNWRLLSLSITENGNRVVWENHYRMTTEIGAISTIGETPEGALWMLGTSAAELDPTTGEMRAINLSIEPSVHQIWSSLTEKKQLFIGVFQNGLWKYDATGFSRFPLPKPFQNISPLSITRLEDQSLLLVVDEGLLRYDGSSWTLTHEIEKVSSSQRPTFFHNRQCIAVQAEQSFFVNLNNSVLTLVNDRMAPTVDLHLPATEVGTPGNLLASFNAVDPWHHTNRNQLEYSYRLDYGSWTIFTRQNNRMFLNLTPGPHHLQLRARDAFFNISPETATASFSVEFPIWLQPSFYLPVLSMSALVLTLGIKLLQAKQKQYRTELSHAKNMEKMKSRFFTNISHEFRTPLTLILTPVENLLRQTPKHTQLSLIQRNAKRLLRLVNQLLDIRKLEAGRLNLHPILDDLARFTRDVCAGFNEAIEQKNGTLIISTGEKPIFTEFDPDKMEKILYNLLSNALKFMNSSIQVTLSSSRETVTISINDDGPGVPEAERETIFDLFHQSPTTEGGTGIGLSYVKELVGLHGGTIYEHNRPEGGACFTLTIPVRTTEATNVSNRRTISNGPRLLLVEDNADLRLMLRSELESVFKVTESPDGENGLSKARESLPDIIISDVMMPKMNGNDLCKTLKNDPLTSHIPILLLTARSAANHEIEGLKCGADDYLAKPFNTAVLKARLETLLENRRRLHHKFAEDPSVNLQELAPSNLDKQLLRNAEKIIAENLSNEDFTIDDFAELMCMSRTNLFRKLKAVTGQTPADFIKTIRLNKAASMLLKEEGSVLDIAISCSFAGHPQFTRAFKKQFGVTPKKYASCEPSQ